jgi:hypothetical protein
MLEGGQDSPLWQAMKKHGVDLYLCGEVHAITCTQADDVLQIAHGGLFGYNPKVNYLLGTVSGDQIKLELKEIEIVNSGEKLWQVGNNRPRATVTIADDVKQKGFTTVGTATLERTGTATILTNPTGCFVQRTGPAESLHGAVSEGDIDQVRLHISKGGDVNEKVGSGVTPLHVAAYGGRNDVAKLLISKGADVNAKDNMVGRHCTLQYLTTVGIWWSCSFRKALMSMQRRGPVAPLYITRCLPTGEMWPSCFLKKVQMPT